MTTDISEKGLETLIMRHMTGVEGHAVTPNMVAEPPAPYGGTGYFAGSAKDYDRAHALDVPQLFAFLRATPPEAFKKLALADVNDSKDINRLKLLARVSSEIMVDHFHEQVLQAGKIGGQARAMVVTSGIERAIQYFHAVKAYLEERKSPYQAIVAFSGQHEYGGAMVSEASLNGFSSGDIAEKIQSDPYRFLICADKFQTGYDEPLLHTMYVDKPLSGIKAVQTLSRLNRAHPQKHDCFVLDFQNNSEAITFAFQDYYRTMLLAEETDPNKLHDLKAALDGAQVYSPEQVQQVVELFLGGADRDKLDCLSNILKTFNEHFGTLFTDVDRVARRIRDDIAPKVAADTAYRNAKENTPHTARMAHDQALGKVMQLLLKDDTQVYKQFVENESFRRFVGDMVYVLTSP
jgi:type I site-specific restriction-modification system R (restriction) subunit